MKKFFLIIAMILIAVAAYAAGTCTQKIDKVGSAKVLTWTCAANADGTIPSNATTSAILNEIDGYYITEVRIVPGLPAPTDAYDISIKDVSSIDMLGGSGANASNATATRVIPASGTPLVAGNISLVVENQSVNAANFTVKAMMDKQK